jgi:hypothetical protein
MPSQTSNRERKSDGKKSTPSQDKYFREEIPTNHGQFKQRTPARLDTLHQYTDSLLQTIQPTKR